MPPPSGIQPFDWAIIVALVGVLAGFVRYVWNDARKRDGQDKADIATQIANFSTRVDKGFDDIRARVHDHANRIQVQAERLAVVESQRTALEKSHDDLHGQLERVSDMLQRVHGQVQTIAGRMGISQSGGNMPSVPRPRGDR